MHPRAPLPTAASRCARPAAGIVVRQRHDHRPLPVSTSSTAAVTARPPRRPVPARARPGWSVSAISGASSASSTSVAASRRGRAARAHGSIRRRGAHHVDRQGSSPELADALGVLASGHEMQVGELGDAVADRVVERALAELAPVDVGDRDAEAGGRERAASISNRSPRTSRTSGPLAASASVNAIVACPRLRAKSPGSWPPERVTRVIGLPSRSISPTVDPVARPRGASR